MLDRSLRANPEASISWKIVVFGIVVVAAGLLMLSAAARTLWRWIKERPDFPRPIRLSARCTVIDGDQLIAWRDAQAEKVA